MKFIWDIKKAKINRKKYGISFETIVRVFLDKNSYDDYDEFHSDFEDIIKIVGKVGKILAVIYTERENKNRIISARQADKDETSYKKSSRNLNIRFIITKNCKNYR